MTEEEKEAQAKLIGMDYDERTNTFDQTDPQGNGYTFFDADTLDELPVEVVRDRLKAHREMYGIAQIVEEGQKIRWHIVMKKIRWHIVMKKIRLFSQKEKQGKW
jgi:hypothetical protein